MKKLVSAAIVSIIGLCGLCANAATVWYQLEINPVSNTWSLFADDSLGDNGGLAIWTVTLNNVNFPVTIQAPFLKYQDNNTLASHEMGFVSFAETNNPNPIGSAQDGDVPVYGFGQTAGSLTLPANNSQTGARQTTYAAHVLLATGSYSGVAPSFSPSTGDDSANVFFADGNSTQVVVPNGNLNFSVTTVPEPTTAMILLPLACMFRRRGSIRR